MLLDQVKSKLINCSLPLCLPKHKMQDVYNERKGKSIQKKYEVSKNIAKIDCLIQDWLLSLKQSFKLFENQFSLHINMIRWSS